MHERETTGNRRRRSSLGLLTTKRDAAWDTQHFRSHRGRDDVTAGTLTFDLQPRRQRDSDRSE